MILTPDKVVAFFETGAALLICLSVRRLYIDKKVRGVSVWPIFFFAAWGFWNLYWYPFINAWWAFSAGIGVVTINTIWVLQMIYYNWKEKNWR